MGPHPVTQVLRQQRVDDQAILLRGVRPHIGRGRRDRAEFDTQWVLRSELGVMLIVGQSRPRATGAVPELTPTSDMARRQIEPQILRVTAFLTLPGCRVLRYFDTVVKLDECSGVLGLDADIARIPRCRLKLRSHAVVIDDGLNDIQDIFRDLTVW